MKTLKLVEKSKIWFSIAIVLVLISVGSLLIRGLNFGIDFVGGTIVTIDLHTQFNTDDARQITDQYDKSAEITYAGDGQDRIVISTKESLDTDQRKELFNQFKDKYSLQDSDLVSVDTVTATVGSETARNAVVASAIAVLLMLIYITFRFEFYFGLSAIIALLYDITIVIGVYALFQIQVNVSVSQTLKRSINTVVTTLLAILALYIFGVEAIRSFALPLIVGIVSGCYSSIFVASPLWVQFQKRFPNSKSNKKNKKRAVSNTNKGRNKQPQV